MMNDHEEFEQELKKFGDKTLKLALAIYGVYALIILAVIGFGIFAVVKIIGLLAGG